jgi:hypothetical protein
MNIEGIIGKFMISVRVHLKETSQAITHSTATNTYTKGPFYCVYESDVVYKYPIANIWRVVEDYK